LIFFEGVTFMNQVFSRGGSGMSVYAVAILLGLGLMLGQNSAHAVLFAKGNAELGAKLHAKTCASCHNSMMPERRWCRVLLPRTTFG